MDRLTKEERKTALYVPTQAPDTKEETLKSLTGINRLGSKMMQTENIRKKRTRRKLKEKGLKIQNHYIF